MKQKTLVLRQIYSEGIAILEQAGIEEASLDAWYLLEYVTGISRASYYGDPERELTPEQAEQYMRCVGIRSTRVPLQHITGEQEFMGYPFYVNEHVLIPRQDTEALVEEAVRVIRQEMDRMVTEDAENYAGTAGNHMETVWKPIETVGDSSKTVEDALMNRQYQILDMCTGSGCILLSILKMYPGVSGTGCDISREALAVARKNAQHLGVEAEFYHGDLFAALPKILEKEKELNQENCKNQDICENQGTNGTWYDMIISNPPYIRTGEIKELQEEVKLHDPRIALNGGADGLYFYRRIVADSVHYITDGGYLMFEIGYDQAENVTGLMETAGYQEIVVKKDLAGLDRVVMGRYYLH